MSSLLKSLRSATLAAGIAGVLLVSAIVTTAIRAEPPPASQGVSASPGGTADAAIASRAGGIVGSKHDFSGAGAVPRDLCTPCHTPHITAAQAPLLVGGPEAPLRSYKTPAGQLDAASLVCLSCHDGTVARDVYAGAHATNWADRSRGDLSPGRGRVTNHPVGVAYPDAAEGYHSSAAVTGGGRIHLPNGRIQCTTCHDPHNSTGVPGMLVISNERSRLCLACHRL